MASHFVLDIFWTCNIYIDIYLAHVDACFMVLYVSVFMMMHDVVFCMFPMCDDECANLEYH